jgi:hypothetical protein
VRVEAKRASEEYGRVLRRYPLKPGETVERPQRGEVVSSSGVLPHWTQANTKRGGV